MINHKQSVEEHALEVKRQEDLAARRYARKVARGILRDIAIMAEVDGEDAANEFFSPTIVRTRARIGGVQESLLWLAEKVVAEGRNHD